MLNEQGSEPHFGKPAAKWSFGAQPGIPVLIEGNPIQEGA